MRSILSSTKTVPQKRQREIGNTIKKPVIHLAKEIPHSNSKPELTTDNSFHLHLPLPYHRPIDLSLLVADICVVNHIIQHVSHLGE